MRVVRAPSGKVPMTEKEIDTLPRPTKQLGEKHTGAPSVAKSRFMLDMGQASREQGFKANGCR